MPSFDELFASEQERLGALGTPNLRDKLSAALTTLGSGGEEDFSEALSAITGGRVEADVGLQEQILGNLASRQELGITERETGVREAAEARKQFELAIKQGDATAKRVQELFPGSTVDELVSISQEMADLNGGRDPVGLQQIDDLASQAGQNLGIEAPRLGETALAEKTRTIQESGVDPDIAAGIASGRFVVSEGIVLDKATGERIGAAPADAVTPAPAPAAPVPDITAATGPSGVFQNAMNVIAGTVTDNLPFPESEEGKLALEKLSVRTATTLQDAVPGRPSNFLLQKVEKFAVQPTKFFQGDARARVNLRQTRDFIEEQLGVLNGILASDVNLTRSERGKVATKVAEMGSLLGAYDEIIGAAGISGGDVDLTEFVR